MSRKVLFVVLIALLLVAITGGVAYADGPGNGKGQGKAKGHVKQEEKANSGNSSNDSGSSSNPSESASSDSGGADSGGPKGNGNTGSSKTRKGLDDDKMNQNIYAEGDTLSYHVSNRHAGENTIIVKKPGKNGEVVFETTVMVGEDGTLDVVLTDIPESWSGVYQVQIWDDKGMKNDNINIKRPHLANPEDLPSAEEPDSPEPVDDSSEEPIESMEPVDESKPADEDGDCITVVYHASSVAVTVVEFFRPEDAREPWLHEDTRLGESRVDTEGAVVAQFATGVVFVVFEYDEATGAYNYRGTGEVVGDHDELIHIWSDGDASSVLFDALVWTPVGAGR